MWPRIVLDVVFDWLFDLEQCVSTIISLRLLTPLPLLPPPLLPLPLLPLPLLPPLLLPFLLLPPLLPLLLFPLFPPPPPLLPLSSAFTTKISLNSFCTSFLSGL